MHRRCCRLAAPSVHYTTNCKQSLVLLRMGDIIARNMLSWLKLLINCYCCIYSVVSNIVLLSCQFRDTGFMPLINTQPCAPEDGRKCRPKHVDLIKVINKLSLFHLFGWLYYCITLFSIQRHTFYAIYTPGLATTRWNTILGPDYFAPLTQAPPPQKKNTSLNSRSRW